MSFPGDLSHFTFPSSFACVPIFFADFNGSTVNLQSLWGELIRHPAGAIVGISKYSAVFAGESRLYYFFPFQRAHSKGNHDVLNRELSY